MERSRSRERRPRTGNVLIVDTETTGLDATKHKCIEFAAILFNIEHSDILSEIATLLPLPASHENEAQHINHISTALTRRAPPPESFMRCLAEMAANADFALAHNAAFDKKWFGLDGLQSLALPWICTQKDVRWPVTLRTSPRLTDLALAFGITIVPQDLHRALADCRLLANVLKRCDNVAQLLQASHKTET